MKKNLIKFLLVSLFVFPGLTLCFNDVQALNDDEKARRASMGMGFVDGQQAVYDTDWDAPEGWDSDKNRVYLGANDPRTMAAGIINTILTILGIVAVVIVLLGGFKWMTAAGNEEKVGEAKKLLGAGVIGLIIVLSAWGIASFVLNQMATETGLGTPPGTTPADET